MPAVLTSSGGAVSEPLRPTAGPAPSLAWCLAAVAVCVCVSEC